MNILDAIEKVYRFLLDKTKHIALRLSVSFILIVLLFVLNDLSGFSRSYFLNRKLDQLIELKRIEPNILISDTLFAKKYTITKQEILNDKSKLKSTWIWLKSIEFSASNGHQTSPIPNPQNELNKHEVWFDISSMLFAYLLSFLLFIIMISSFFMNRSSKENVNVVTACIFLILALLGIGRVIKGLLSISIPLFHQNLWINYSLNVLVQVLLVLFITKLAQRFGKR